MADPHKVPAMLVGVENARPYGLAGNMPADAVVTARKPHGEGRFYVSDVPYDEPYNDRATCAGTRTEMLARPRLSLASRIATITTLGGSRWGR
jgi:hypothetical protein